MMPAHPERRGLIVGRYALHGEFAAGGMATVHFGRLLGPAGFCRIVAIKRLHTQLANQPEFVSMFLDEVRLTARIQHPNVVATIDAVEEQGELFLVMDYIHGESLARLIRMAGARGQQVPPKIATSIICGLLHGLHAAHEATSESNEPLGVVHRDVSPQNVIVGLDGVARVLDFGIAKAEVRLQTTRQGQIKGKMSYLAPEHVRGAPVDRRTDVYGAGVVLWEALTGVPLISGDNDAITLAKVLAEPVVSPAVHVPDLPPGLAELTMRAIERDREARFPTAREMGLALQREVGVVSPCEVGDWVASLAGESLATRWGYVIELERLSVGRRMVPPSSKCAAVPAASEPAWMPSLKRTPLAFPSGPPIQVVSAAPAKAPKRPTKRVVGITVLALCAMAAAVGSAWPLRVKVGSGAALAASGSSARPAALELAMPSAAPAAVAVAPVALVDENAPAARNERPVSVTREPPTEPRAAVVGAASAASVANAPRRTPTPGSRPSPSSCTPPFTIDGAGIKHFKVECL